MARLLRALHDTPVPRRSPAPKLVGALLAGLLIAAPAFAARGARLVKDINPGGDSSPPGCGVRKFDRAANRPVSRADRVCAPHTEEADHALGVRHDRVCPPHSLRML